MGFFRQEYWSGLSFPSPGDLPDPGIELMSPALTEEFFADEPPGKIYKPRIIQLLVAQMVNNLPAMQETRFNPWVEKIPWRREWQHTLVFLPGEFHGQRSLMG